MALGDPDRCRCYRVADLESLIYLSAWVFGGVSLGSCLGVVWCGREVREGFERGIRASESKGEGKGSNKASFIVYYNRYVTHEDPTQLSYLYPFFHPFIPPFFFSPRVILHPCVVSVHDASLQLNSSRHHSHSHLFLLFLLSCAMNFKSYSLDRITNIPFFFFFLKYLISFLFFSLLKCPPCS